MGHGISIQLIWTSSLELCGLSSAWYTVLQPYLHVLVPSCFQRVRGSHASAIPRQKDAGSSAHEIAAGGPGPPKEGLVFREAQAFELMGVVQHLWPAGRLYSGAPGGGIRTLLSASVLKAFNRCLP